MPMCWPTAARACCSCPRRCIPSSRTSSAGCRISNMSWCPAATRSATRSSPMNLQRKPIPLRPCRPMPRSRHSGSIPPAPPACPRACGTMHSNLQATAETYGKQVLGIREGDVCLSAAKLFFAYGLGNALTFPMSVGASTVLNAERPTPARMRDLLNKYNPTIFYGAPTLFAAMLNDEATKNAQAQRGCASVPPQAKRCRNRSAMPGRHASASTSSTASARRSCCTSSCRTRPATSSTAAPAVRCLATRCGLV